MPYLIYTSVKLPKLQLAMFSGDRMELQGFWDMFGTAVLSNDTLSDVQKFAYMFISTFHFCDHFFLRKYLIISSDVCL